MCISRGEKALGLAGCFRPLATDGFATPLTGEMLLEMASSSQSGTEGESKVGSKGGEAKKKNVTKDFFKVCKVPVLSGNTRSIMAPVLAKEQTSKAVLVKDRAKMAREMKALQKKMAAKEEVAKHIAPLEETYQNFEKKKVQKVQKQTEALLEQSNALNVRIKALKMGVFTDFSKGPARN